MSPYKWFHPKTGKTISGPVAITGNQLVSPEQGSFYLKEVGLLPCCGRDKHGAAIHHFDILEYVPGNTRGQTEYTLLAHGSWEKEEEYKEFGEGWHTFAIFSEDRLEQMVEATHKVDQTSGGLTFDISHARFNKECTQTHAPNLQKHRRLGSLLDPEFVKKFTLEMQEFDRATNGPDR